MRSRCASRIRPSKDDEGVAMKFQGEHMNPSGWRARFSARSVGVRVILRDILSMPSFRRQFGTP